MLRFMLPKTLTFDTVAANARRFMQMMHHQTQTDVVVDASDVTACDSAGLALLLEVRRVCKAQLCSLTIEGLRQNMLDLATFYHVDELCFEGDA